jgi:hypothetical protein
MISDHLWHITVSLHKGANLTFAGELLNAHDHPDIFTPMVVDNLADDR